MGIRIVPNHSEISVCFRKAGAREPAAPPADASFQGVLDKTGAQSRCHLVVAEEDLGFLDAGQGGHAAGQNFVGEFAAVFEIFVGGALAC